MDKRIYEIYMLAAPLAIEFYGPGATSVQRNMPCRMRRNRC